jgi:hypothetical protein
VRKTQNSMTILNQSPLPTETLNTQRMITRGGSIIMGEDGTEIECY